MSKPRIREVCESYRSLSGQEVSFTSGDKYYNVSCWNAADTCLWSKDYTDYDTALKEFERWRR